MAAVVAQNSAAVAAVDKAARESFAAAGAARHSAVDNSALVAQSFVAAQNSAAVDSGLYFAAAKGDSPAAAAVLCSAVVEQNSAAQAAEISAESAQNSAGSAAAERNFAADNSASVAHSLVDSPKPDCLAQAEGLTPRRTHYKIYSPENCHVDLDILKLHSYPTNLRYAHAPYPINLLLNCNTVYHLKKDFGALEIIPPNHSIIAQTFSNHNLTGIIRDSIFEFFTS